MKRRRSSTGTPDTISEDLIGAATAVTGGSSTNTGVSTPTKNQSPKVGLGVSPLSKAKLTDQYITQLQRLQTLLDNNILTPDEFAEQKRSLNV